MTRIASLALIATLLAAPAASLHAQPATDGILPGYWETKTKLGGVTAVTDLECLSPAEAAKFLSGPCNRHHTCTYPVKQVGNGRANFDGYWLDKKGRKATVRASGTYSPTAFNLRASGKTTHGIPLALTLVGKRLSATCPAA